MSRTAPEEFPPEVIAEIRQILADGEVQWATMSPLERAHNLLTFIVWECKLQGWMLKDQSVEDWLSAAEKELAASPPALVSYMTGETSEERDAAFLRTYAARVLDRTASSWEIPNTVATTLQDIARRIESRHARLQTLQRYELSDGEEVAAPSDTGAWVLWSELG